MKEFSGVDSRLHNLPLLARVTYSIFLLFTLSGLVVSVLLAGEMLGSGLGELRDYYAGAEAAAATPGNTAQAGGPRLDLPDEALAGFGSEPQPLRQALEITHFHLFSMPIVLMVLSHLFLLSNASARSKVFWVAASSLSVASHMAAPWLARANLSWSTPFYAISGASLAIAFLVLAVVPLREMWT